MSDRDEDEFNCLMESYNKLVLRVAQDGLKIDKLKDCVGFYAEGHHFNHDDTSVISVDFRNGSKIRTRLEGKMARKCLKELES